MKGDTLHGMALFAGVGGLELGLQVALGDAYRCVCYVEREAYAASTLVARMEDKTLDRAPVWDDVSSFDGKAWRGKVDLISGGFPCQDISVAGKGEGIKEGTRSGLWGEFARIIREVRPRLVFVENVSALLARGVDRVLGDLAEMGFDAEWGSVRAADVGAPHRRERIFILAQDTAGVGWRRRGDGDSGGSGRKIQIAGLCGGLAEPEAGGQRVVRKLSRRDGQLDGNHEELDDSPSARQPRKGRSEESSTVRDEARSGESDRRRGEVADTEGDHGRTRERGEEEGTRERGERRRGSSVRDGELADADCSRTSQRRGDSRMGWIGQPFPPGPADREAWERILAVYPELAPAVVAEPTNRKNRQVGISSRFGYASGAEIEPAVCRVADGMAYRVDRLRACGNGVVPLQAAVAFIELARCFGPEGREILER